jgi:hypothetical protein
MAQQQSAAITYSAIAFSCPWQLHNAAAGGSKDKSIMSVPAEGAWYRRSFFGMGMVASNLMPTITSADSKCAASPGWVKPSLKSTIWCSGQIKVSKFWRKLVAF